MPGGEPISQLPQSGHWQEEVRVGILKVEVSRGHEQGHVLGNARQQRYKPSRPNVGHLGSRLGEQLHPELVQCPAGTSL